MGRLSEYVNGARRRTVYLDTKKNFNIEIDLEQVNRMLEILDDEEIKRDALFKAVKAGARVLQSTAKDYFKQRMGESANHYSKYLKAPFFEGVIIKGDKAYCEVRVSIMKDFRMKFYETGTEDRYIKQRGHSDLQKGRHVENTGKSNYRGRIGAKWFFKDARTNSDSLINEAMINSIDKTLKRYDI